MAEDDTAERDDSQSPGRSLNAKIAQAMDATLKALAAFAGVALGKVGFDQIREGLYDDWRWIWLVVSVGGFALGAVLATGSVLAMTRSARVSHGWLLSNRGKHVRQRIELTPYMFGGGGSTLAELNQTIEDLVDARYENPGVFNLDLNGERTRLRMLIKARSNTLDLAVAEQAQRRSVTFALFLGVVLTAVAAAGFALVTTEAKAARDDRDRAIEEEQRLVARSETLADEDRKRAQTLEDAARARAETLEDAARERTEQLEDRQFLRFPIGEVLPGSTTRVRLMIPSSESTVVSETATALSFADSDACDLATVEAFVIDVANAPTELGDPLRVIHLVTAPSATCRRAELYLRPTWFVPAGDPAVSIVQGDDEALPPVS